MPQVDARPAALDALARPGNPVSWTLTFPASYLTGRTFTASVGGTAVTPVIVGDVMTIALSGAQTTALGNGRHAFLLTDTTGDDAVRIAGRLLLGNTSTESNDTAVTITVANTVTVTVTVLGASTIASVNGQTGVVVLDAGDVGADPAGTAAAGDAALDARLDAIEGLGSLATDAEIAAAIAAQHTADNGTYVPQGAETFNVADYDTGTSQAAFTQAVAAVEAAGGTLVIPAGTYSAKLSLTANVPILVLAHGATLTVPTNETGVYISRSAGSQAEVLSIHGLTTTAAVADNGSIGWDIEETNNVHTYECRAELHSIGGRLHDVSDPDNGCENNHIRMTIERCVRGWQFKQETGAFPSFMNNHFELEINRPDIGLELLATSGTQFGAFARCTFQVYCWLPTNGVAVSVDADISRSAWFLGGEAPGGATGAHGIKVGANAIGFDQADINTCFQPSITAANLIDLSVAPSGMPVLWRRGMQQFYVTNGAPTELVANALRHQTDTFARFGFGGGSGSNAPFPSGTQGAFFGSGSAAPDIALFRSAAKTLRVSYDAAFGAGRFSTGSRPSASTVGEGAQIYDTTLDVPVWSDGTSWKTAVDTSVLQPLDSDLTAIAALTTTTFGRSLLEQATAAATLTTLGISSFVQTLLDDADAAAARATLGAVKFPALKAGVYYTMEGTSSTGAVGLTDERAIPILVGSASTVDRIGIEVTTAGAATFLARLGIYADSGSGFPGALVLDAGTIALDSIAVKEITVNQALPAGWYWLACCPQGSGAAATVRTVSANMSYPLGATAIGSANNFCARDATGPTGALENPFATDGTMSNFAPRIFVRGA